MRKAEIRAAEQELRQWLAQGSAANKSGMTRKKDAIRLLGIKSFGEGKKNLEKILDALVPEEKEDR